MIGTTLILAATIGQCPGGACPPSPPRVVQAPGRLLMEPVYTVPYRGPADPDPYGFTAILNGYRARAGLPPVAYDAGLGAWAASNNAAQARRGLGHHVLAPGCRQNSGVGYGSAAAVAQAWMASPGHRAAMLARGITRVGIARGPGATWTMNAR